MKGLYTEDTLLFREYDSTNTKVVRESRYTRSDCPEKPLADGWRDSFVHFAVRHYDEQVERKKG